jgi:hypothetical protein
MIEPKSDFVERICNERWQIEATSRNEHQQKTTQQKTC